ncbi:hypothetical protein IQ235_12155 [Oscillatoriales cyanobacterium LEGE 11467]|uniref:Uncharacterized protein n=1 Tax=Zarconia navalis LEGE 11467 TaxID=1828826 RepID=A0A928W0B1_9CYAN|nr:hypothetical protein [Zarconia navalis]MBE9041533.1 hypothetical protein [Zarconia navalis LEGE 11467]
MHERNHFSEEEYIEIRMVRDGDLSCRGVWGEIAAVTHPTVTTVLSSGSL